MGYMIYSLDVDGNHVSELDVPMGTFRMLKQQMYDWFKLIDARECDGDMSGRGVIKRIELEKLREALESLKVHDTMGTLARLPLDVRAPFGYSTQQFTGIPGLNNFIVMRGTQSEFEDTFLKYSGYLESFMEDTIAWCEEHGKTQVEVAFG